MTADKALTELVWFQTFPEGVHGMYEYGDRDAFLNDRMLFHACGALRKW